VEWELETAWQLVEAGRLAGDTAMERLGWRRFSDGLRNLTVSALAAQLIPMLLELRGIREDRATDSRVLDHKLDLLMTLAESNQKLLGKIEARLALVEVVIVPGIVARVEALEAVIGQQPAGR
jgi:hypothetical protein